MAKKNKKPIKKEPIIEADLSDVDELVEQEKRDEIVNVFIDLITKSSQRECSKQAEIYSKMNQFLKR